MRVVTWCGGAELAEVPDRPSHLQYRQPASVNGFHVRRACFEKRMITLKNDATRRQTGRGWAETDWAQRARDA